MPPNEPTTEKSTRGQDSNPDPITGEPGAHPAGTGVGAAAGGAAGAAIGSLAGPIGTAIGTVIGAVAGGLAGKGVAESIDPTVEDAYWREHHGKQEYATDDRPFDAFAPAYRTGYSGYREGQSFDEREAELRTEYEAVPVAGSEAKTPGTMQNPLRWDEAREAARSAYERVRRGEAAKRPT